MSGSVQSVAARSRNPRGVPREQSEQTNVLAHLVLSSPAQSPRQVMVAGNPTIRPGRLRAVYRAPCCLMRQLRTRPPVAEQLDEIACSDVLNGAHVQKRTILVVTLLEHVHQPVAIEIAKIEHVRFVVGQFLGVFAVK